METTPQQPKNPEAAISKEAKIEELQKKIAAAERGFNLAISLGDDERAMQMNTERQNLEATLADLQGDLDFTPNPADYEEDAFSKAVRADPRDDSLRRG